ncbi:hypothetical protein MXB_2213 [Myxobolus squamalis]|nr:hypothetical protein MXB_2213 [Myxobolus squamalis]
MDAKPRNAFLRLFYIIAFFLFGVVNLLAWTAFITNIEYFHSKLVENNTLYRIFESWFFMISTIIGLMGNILNLMIM